MATFPYTPDWGAAPDLQPRVLQAKFGDGYDQRAADGLNDLLATWKLTFSRRTQAEATAISAWFARHRAHVTAFDWAGPFGGATAEQFGTGDGTTKNWVLTGAGIPVSTATATSIWRNDWQGNQLLYPTARTNLITYSEDFTHGSWTKTGTTVTANAWTAPSGAITGDNLVETATTGLHQLSKAAFSSVLGQAFTASVYAKAGPRRLRFALNDGTSFALAMFDLLTGTVVSTSAGTASIVSLGGGVYRCIITGTGTATGTNNGTAYIQMSADGVTVSYTGDGTSYISIWGYQLETRSVATSYIGTAASAVTITDYTVSGASVSFGVAPVYGATLTWSGSYTFKFIATKWTQPRPDDFNSWSVTAEFRQVPA